MYEIIWKRESRHSTEICKNISTLTSHESKKGSIREIVKFYQTVESNYLSKEQIQLLYSSSGTHQTFRNDRFKNEISSNIDGISC